MVPMLAVAQDVAGSELGDMDKMEEAPFPQPGLTAKRHHHHRVLALIDALAPLCAVAKGRSSAPTFWSQICQLNSNISAGSAALVPTTLQWHHHEDKLYQGLCSGPNVASYILLFASLPSLLPWMCFMINNFWVPATLKLKCFFLDTFW